MNEPPIYVGPSLTYPQWLETRERRRRRLKLLGSIALAACLAASIGASLLLAAP